MPHASHLQLSIHVEQLPVPERGGRVSCDRDSQLLCIQDRAHSGRTHAVAASQPHKLGDRTWLRYHLPVTGPGYRQRGGGAGNQDREGKPDGYRLGRDVTARPYFPVRLVAPGRGDIRMFESLHLRA